MLIRKRIQLGLLLLFVLGSYYPVLFAGETLIDDRKMLLWLDDVNRVDIGQLFLSHGGLYYRPLTMLTFMYDKLWWDLDPGFMHLENVLLHLLNVLLVFWGARVAARRFRWNEKLFPFCAAALFALHPVNVEAVAWISGRTDLLATVFILLGTIMAVYAAERSSGLLAGAAMLVLVMGGTAKETALFAAPVLLAILWLSAADRRAAFRLVAAALFPCLLAAIAYLALRSGNFSTLDQGFQLLARGTERYPWFDMPRVVFKVIGFYVKKLFIPHPLNFAIISVSNWYVPLGLAAIAVAGYFAWKRRHPVAVLACLALVLLIPALVVAFIGIAWTPVAERYLYQATIFWALAIALALSRLLRNCHRQDWMVPVSMLAILPMTLATADRAALWGDPVAFYADTLKKSPQFNSLRNELGLALAEKGEDTAAAEQFTAAIRNDPEAGNVLYYVNRALLLSRQDQDEEARRFLQETLAKKPAYNSVELYKALIRVDTKLLHQNHYAEQKLILEVSRELLDAWQQVYAVEKDPFSLYRAGQLALQLQDQRRAGDFFARACRQAPADGHYREPACKLAERFKSVAD